MKTLSTPGRLAEISSRIAEVTHADQSRWGIMTPHQMLCHLSDAFRYTLEGREISPLRLRMPRPVFKWMALSAPLRWPPGIAAPPEIDQRIGGTPPGEFEADRAALQRRLDEFAHRAGPWRMHPMFGAMTAKDWMRWGYLHCDHHLRQFGR